MNSRFFQRYHLWLCFACSSLILPFITAAAQQPNQPKADSVAQSVEKESDEEEGRRMFRTFRQRRQSTTPNQTTAAAKNRPRNRSTNPSSNSYATEVAFIGFSVWEMRESQNGTERRSFVKKKNDGRTSVMRPFRLGSETPLAAGERYFFSIESDRAGYLYVIDREQYADGTQGTPLLLFPTKCAHCRTNRIAAGELVEIPDQKSEDASFEAEKHGLDNIGETLTILVSPKPLIDDSKLKDDPITLEPDVIRNWERDWATRSRWVENIDAVGRGYTEEEGRAGDNPNYKLKENAPLPQRLYQLRTKAGAPLIVSLQLRYRDSSK